jgi:hypothetical protein
MNHKSVIVAGVAFAAACSGPSNAGQLISKQPINPDIAEAVFRHQFAQGPWVRVAAYCIGLSQEENHAGDMDPPPVFILRFADILPPVKARSQCETSYQHGATVKATGERALIFTITSMKCTSDTACEVKASYYAGPLAAAGWTYSMVSHGGKRGVTKGVMGWVS